MRRPFGDRDRFNNRPFDNRREGMGRPPYGAHINKNEDSD